ncbi:TerB family tellurite resistance protein [Flavobacteriaceae bacterium]|nr:TerB family tellurite resistance protein [Flavobacteriaceae bacterium]MDB4066356.1 TerB family tellurite resistance protein [Flavobacteriaceae bacterium]|tara:strand:- start:536 stop:952 length:417 start_codon:yes stop_codon:yes gene_type:complete
MSISDIYSSGFKNRNRDHFAAIVRVALSDGIINDDEQAFLNRTAINLEVEEEEYQNILKNADTYKINPPSTTQNRLERLYDLTRMVYADSIADEGEKSLLRRLVTGLGFSTDADEIVNKAIELVAAGKDEDEFIAAFK